MSHALAVREHLLPDATTWQTMLSMAESFMESGLLPAGVKSPAAALLIIQKGVELGIPPTYALSNISVINGKPVTGAELMLALIYRDHGDQAIRITETTAERCEIAYKRRSWPGTEVVAWTTEDAKKAGLLAKGGPWSQYPAAMLRARCISACARMAFPDSIGGLYTPEELGAEVAVSDDGEITVVEPRAPVVSIVDRGRDETPVPVPDSPSKQSRRAPTSDQFESWSRGVDQALQLGLNIGNGIPDLPENASREEYSGALATLRVAVEKAREDKRRVKAAVAAEEKRLAEAPPAPAPAF